MLGRSGAKELNGVLVRQYGSLVDWTVGIWWWPTASCAAASTDITATVDVVVGKPSQEGNTRHASLWLQFTRTLQCIVEI
jgi:hypothetical protein